MRLSSLLIAGILFSYRPEIASGRSPHDQTSCCGVVTTEGQRLVALIDSMHVDQLWLAHRHINWETGEPDRLASYMGPGRATHCSAFAAAVGERLGVYVLRPPQHGQILLASAQTAWFHEEGGVSQGWKPLSAPDRETEAQTLANHGNLVMIAYESPNPRTPGHIVVVRPADKSAVALERDGPDVAEAGTLNYSMTIAATAFSHHLGAWPDRVRYYWHPVDWQGRPQ